MVFIDSLSSLPLIGSFFAGLFAPLLAVCVLPLYPAFLSYLANQISTKGTKKDVDNDSDGQNVQIDESTTKKRIFYLGVIATLGVIASMFLVGLIFTFFLQESLTNAIGIISPIAFGILALISLFLIFNFDFSRIFPKINSPKASSPYWSSFLFGFFFGAIVLPCNPASLVVLFAISASTVSFITNLFNFILFGFGMGLPLLIFSFISSQKSQIVISWLGKNKRRINLVAGLILLGISIYYLYFVFKIFS